MPIEFTLPAPPTVRADPKLRSTLLDYYISNSTPRELTDWLKGLGQDPRGTIPEREARVREHTKYLGMAPADFPRQTIDYLDQYPSNHLGSICKVLELDDSGAKDQRWRRVMRHVALCERWVVLPETVSDGFFTLDNVLPFVRWHLVVRRGDYEKDFYPGFADDMEGFFGEAFVHKQLPIAFGTTLKIDFHLGHPQKPGVGVEFKMPTNNAELQRAEGQLRQYRERYGQNLVLVLLPGFVDRAQQRLFVDYAESNGIAVILK
jgi:hypothetical protein